MEIGDLSFGGECFGFFLFLNGGVFVFGCLFVCFGKIVIPQPLPLSTFCSHPGGKLSSQLMTLWRNWSRDWSSPGSSTTLTSSIPQTMAITQVRGRVRYCCDL